VQDGVLASWGLKGDEMMANLWLTLQLLVVVLSADLDSVVPQSPTHLIVLALLGAALLTPIAAWASMALLRALSLSLRPPSLPDSRRSIREFRMPEEPGTPGTALARAPSGVVHAIA
jgi:hypothetical protein